MPKKMISFLSADQVKKSAISVKTMQLWDQFLSWVFKYSSRCFLEEDKQDILRHEDTEIFHFANMHSRFGNGKVLNCKVTTDPKDITLVSKHLKRIAELELHPKQKELISFEILAKTMAYRKLSKNKTFFIFTSLKNAEANKVKYRVDHVFNLWKHIKAFGLIPTSEPLAPPILLFRGTDTTILSTSGTKSILSDLDPEGPGKKLYLSSREEIQAWATSQSQKVRSVGHSLGGALALYSLIFDKELFSHDEQLPSFAFNYPGLAQDLYEQWALDTKTPAFQGYITKGDLISKFGCLVQKTYQTSIEEELNPIKAHEMLIFSQPKTLIQPIPITEENQSSSRRFYTQFHQQTSLLFYEAGLKYLFPYKESKQ